MKKKLYVGISGINAVDNPGPGIGVARSLKESSGLDVEIIGLAYDAMEPGVYMDWIVDKCFIMPYPSNDGASYIDRLIHIKNTYGLDYVIPNLDAELPVYIKYADTLADWGIKTFLPDMEQFRMRGKDCLDKVAERIDICCPRTKVVNSYDDMLAAIDEIGLPVMVKGSFYKAYKAYNVSQAITHYNSIVAEWGFPIIIQEMVKGEELNIVGVGDGEGNALGMVGAKKMTTTALGKIWTGVTIKNQPMLDAAKRFIREYKWRGPFELECMVDGDKIYIIEINPRFPAWLYFATGVGVNLPERMVKRDMGMEIGECCDYQAGKLFVRYSFELVTDMKSFQEMITQGETQKMPIQLSP